MRIVTVLILLFTGFTAFAQWDVGAGVQVNFPLMYNKAVGDYNHSLGAFGPAIRAKYYPRNGAFYPSFSANFTQVRLPLVKEGGTVVGAILQQLNFTLAANVRKVFENNRELHYGLGIGASHFSDVALEITGSDQGNIASIDAAATGPIQRWVPAVQPFIEYVFPMSQEKPLFVGIGGQVQYIYFFDDGTSYDVHVVNKQYQQQRLKAALSGHMVNPGVQLTVYYRFGQKDGYGY